MNTQPNTSAREEYRAEINNFGGSKPKFEFNNQNKIHIHWSDVKTDGKGNVLKMPLLTSKLCFGRIEYKIRHGHDELGTHKRRGIEYPTESKCSRCPPATKDSCQNLVRERIDASSEIQKKLAVWKRATDTAMKEPDPSHPDKFRPNQFVGNKFGRLWTDVKIAIIDHGRFTNSNDQAVIDQIEQKKERDRIDRAKKMRSKRRWQRLERQAEQKSPPGQFIEAAIQERERRVAQLKAVRKRPTMPRSIKRLTDFGCEMTGYAWYYSLITEFQGRPVKAGTMANWLIDVEKQNQGRSYPTLKDRLIGDIARFRKIEAGDFGWIWNDFNPDDDLDL